MVCSPLAIVVDPVGTLSERIWNGAIDTLSSETRNRSDRYDLITTFDAVHDQAKPDQVLQNIYRALHTDGLYLMQEIRAATNVEDNLNHPLAPYFYTVSCLHCMTVSLAYGGKGFGAMWGQETALQMLAEAGFKRVEIKRLPQDLVNDYYITYK